MTNQEKIIETKTCRNCNHQFQITDKDMEFYERISPVFPSRVAINRDSTRKYLTPPPTHCPACREQRRLAFRNERKLYKRKCDASGKSIISIYSPDKPYKVYSQEEWWSDKWDATSYGRDFDFSKSFFEQFDELMKEVPFIALHNTSNENSEYINLSGYNKDCYLIFAGEYNEKCMYSNRIISCNDCIDNNEITKSQNCYDNVNVESSYKLFFSQNCKNCSDSYFLYSCTDCKNCIGCASLSNKSYCIFNKQYSKEEYLVKKEELFSYKTIDEIKELFKKVKMISIHKGENNINSENCLGDNIFDSKNINIGFDITEMEDSKYVYFGSKGSSLMDVNNTTEQELSYEGLSVGYNSYGIFFVNGGWTCKNIFYSFHMHNSSNCFGCVGLKGKEYCILNKQYTKEEYEELVPKIINHMTSTGEWGEFFPISISPFGYNETVAQEYYPIPHTLPSGERERGIKWHEEEDKNYTGDVYIPKNIREYDEKIVGKEVAERNISELLSGILKCEISGKPYRIIAQELNFYLRYNLPIPKRHPDQRHIDRMKLRNPRKLFDRKCDKCYVEIKTTYNPDRKEIVYCEKCYDKEIY